MNDVLFLRVTFHQVVDVALCTQITKYILWYLIQMKNWIQSYRAKRRSPVNREGEEGPGLAVKILLNRPAFIFEDPQLSETPSSFT